MKIISKRKHNREVYYQLSFSYIDDPQAGFFLDCDKDGKTAPEDAYKRAEFSMRQDLNPPELLEFENRWTDPAVGICDDCKKEVELYDPLTNVCECGAAYNMSGQRLAPYSMWEE